MTTRKDSWELEEDILLAQTVLLHIESGSTQLKAFVEAAEKLSRSKEACGFRWNSTVRKQYSDKIEEAKAKRTQEKHVVSINEAQSALETPKPKEDIVTNTVYVLPNSSEFVNDINDTISFITNELTRLRQLTMLLSDELTEAKRLNSELHEKYTQLENDVLNAVDTKLLIRLANDIRKDSDSERITG
ncbi:RsfA family transcriptional regulator [Paenibacillus xylanilyticus]|uniref:RsfA family transcriptional regulator n=1 Tax=Paenibacillus xylanilyticus TaxID=248903 RepID=A0A7Y6BVF2_9BACL|nr:RsfA family transcriptional regulator [Paenibacillus xylanilyticus]NUU75717.1 RsfA family transcriptional regulator [Paenibacillus xylanilyticus]